MQQTILHFWFGDLDATGNASEDTQQRWWQKDPNFDQMIKQQFATTLQEATQKHYQDWLNQPSGRLALIILLDQFSRNIYRDTSQAFAQDDMALAWAQQGVALGHDQQLLPIQRAFMYMPFEHAESQSMQQQSVKLFEKLYNDSDTIQKPIMQGFVDAAHQHKAIIDRFMRYPHRNAILGRESTQEELAFLQQPNSSF